MPKRRFAEAEVTVDHVYRTPRYNHNAIEPHAPIASWNEEGSLIVFDATQTVSGHRCTTLASVFGLKPEKVQVIAPYVGGGFGGKGWALESHAALRGGGEGDRTRR